MADGVFKKDGIELGWESFGTSSGRMSALMAGNIDIAGTGAVSAIALMARGARQFYIIGVPEDFGRVEGLFVREDINSLEDRKSTRLNSSHVAISYAVFCLKKKKNRIKRRQTVIEQEDRL